MHAPEHAPVKERREPEGGGAGRGRREEGRAGWRAKGRKEGWVGGWDEERERDPKQNA